MLSYRLLSAEIGTRMSLMRPVAPLLTRMLLRVFESTSLMFRHLKTSLILPNGSATREKKSFVEHCRSSFIEKTLIPLPWESKSTDCTSIFFSLEACATSVGHFRILEDFTSLL